MTCEQFRELNESAVKLLRQTTTSERVACAHHYTVCASCRQFIIDVGDTYEKAGITKEEIETLARKDARTMMVDKEL